MYVSVFALRRWAEAARRLKQANTDKLTGLSNRHRSRVILAHEMTHATRYRRLLTIILFDVDSFKNINDTDGHAAGDQILKAVARVARETVRMVDYPIRWGGEEFIVLVPDTGLEESLHLAADNEQLLKTCDVPIQTLDCRMLYLPHITNLTL